MRSLLILSLFFAGGVVAEPGGVRSQPPINPKGRTSGAHQTGEAKRVTTVLAGTLITSVIHKDGDKVKKRFEIRTGDKESNLADRRQIANDFYDYPCLREARNRVVKFLDSEEAWNFVGHGTDQLHRRLDVTVVFEFERDLDPVCTGDLRATVKFETSTAGFAGGKVVYGNGSHTVSIPLNGKGEEAFDYDKAFSAALGEAKKDSVNRWARAAQNHHQAAERATEVDKIFKELP
ncbi:MAG: hypothetical protein HYR96_11710 [Deltaproteobacteria bacterium]|nr:hypothetical protein [Deltaproteobacteria bacterium]MBI3293732.1 hypothetical protein [Deltaproteobacteria bacterium]